MSPSSAAELVQCGDSSVQAVLCIWFVLLFLAPIVLNTLILDFETLYT